jgi:DNA-binding NarL/FixJ family response regulator
MPELNGLQAARQIRQVAPESEIVFLSQHLASDIIHEALAIGARGYVCKSHIASDLVDAVRAAGQIRTFTREFMIRFVAQKCGSPGLNNSNYSWRECPHSTMSRSQDGQNGNGMFQAISVS